MYTIFIPYSPFYTHMFHFIRNSQSVFQMVVEFSILTDNI
jgi:hypothetical protein